MAAHMKIKPIKKQINILFLTQLHDLIY